MEEMLIAAVIVFLALVLTAVNVTKKSLRELSQDEKARLVDAAARTPISWFLAADSRIGMPPRFLRSFLVARGLRLTGAAVLFAAAAVWLLRSHA